MDFAPSGLALHGASPNFALSGLAEYNPLTQGVALGCMDFTPSGLALHR